VRLQPDEAIYMKIVVKKPGLEMDSIVSELDLSYKQRYSNTYIPDAYERLILDAIRGDQQHFVRRWACHPPVLPVLLPMALWTQICGTPPLGRALWPNNRILSRSAGLCK
jgi:hypothetical protein